MSGRYAVQGYQLMANVIFRPILLLLRLVLSMQVLQIIAHLALIDKNDCGFSAKSP